MDAVKFIEEHRRMYKVTGKHLPTLAEGIPAEDVVKEVEEWAAAHPRKTRQSVFLEQWPETVLDSFGVIAFCPKDISAAYRDSRENCKNPEKMCRDCRKEFWMRGVK